MANNSKVTQITSGKNNFTIIDPNPRDSKIIPTEDLFIYVSLKINTKNRSVLQLSDNGINVNQNQSNVINFIGTQVDGSGNEYMSTDWTNIGGNISGNVTGGKNKETFGIKSINISYGADLLPKVSITFIDIKGASLFDGFETKDKNGLITNVSNYSSFFTLPYPVFELTVKGYYGKAVRYCLNMTKWVGSFTNGNFEIKADFIGFSTSFLSDIIIDYVRAVNDTEEGKIELKKIYNIHSKGKTPITINELLRNIGDIDKYVKDIKGNDKETGNNQGYNTLINLNTALSKLSSIRDKIGTNVTNLTTNYSLEGNYIKVNGLIPRSNMFSFRDIIVIDEKNLDKYDMFRKDIIAEINSYNDSLPKSDGVDYKEKYSLEQKSGLSTDKLVPYFSSSNNDKLINLLEPIDNILTGSQIGSGRPEDVGYVNSSEFSKPPFSFTASTSTMGYDNITQYFDFYKLRDVVDSVYISLTEERKSFSDKVSEQINKEIEKKIGFNPSIGNIFEIICHNVEAYLNVIYKVALDSEKKNDGRVKVIKKLNKITDSSVNRIYPFPMLYNEKGEEIYIGSDNNIDEINFPEIKFIETLAASLSKELDDKKKQSENLTNSKKAFPINPADITFEYPPYQFQNASTGNLLSLIIDIVGRYNIAYYYSHFKDKINEIAKFEASALYDLTINQLDRNAITEFLKIVRNNFTTLGIDFPSVIDINSDYNDIFGKNPLYFDVSISPDKITKSFLSQSSLNLLPNVSGALGDKNISTVFTPTDTNNGSIKFDTTYYTINEDLTKISWEENVLNGGTNPITDKIKEVLGTVKSGISKKTYKLNESPSYLNYSSTSGVDMFSDDELRGFMVLSTYPFKKMDGLVKNLKDKAKVVNVPMSYLAWIGGHLKRQYIIKNGGLDIYDSLKSEFSTEQIKDISHYLSLNLKIKGVLPTPFNDIKLFNESIEIKLINVFEHWVKEIKLSGLIDHYLNSGTEDGLNTILKSTRYLNTNNLISLVSYTPNFWLQTNQVNTVDVDSLNNYMNVFIDKFIELNSKNVVKVEENITEKKVKDDNVKQDLYRHVKNIYDKWIGGTIDGKPYNTCGGVSSKDKSLFSYFKFIDSTFSDISDKARINLNSLVILSNNKGVNLSNLVSRVFNENGFILHSLPTYIDYSDKKEVKNIFRTYTRIEDVVSSPTFVGMYNSGNSKILDLGKNSEYRNDSYDFIDDASSIPNTMNDTSTEKSVVVYRVGFGDENQSIFKNLRISQEDFSETSESLQVLSEYVDNKGSTQRVFKGSNLYNLYSLRSYNLNFDMMGNAMIQPLMYLQLDNIPMFHGAYTVMNVSHDITPNTMNTTVRAVRKSKFTVPIVTDSTTFLPLDLNKTLDIKTDVLVNTVTDIPTDNIAPNTLNTFVNPVKGDMIITSKKGFRRGEPHNGVDIGISNGTQLYSSWSGIINRFVQGKDGKEGYGLYAIIDHSNNTEKSFDDGFYYYTLYAHLSNVNVNNLVQVKTGQNFGLSGGIKGAVNSGNSGGPHLHYEIRRSPKKLTDIRSQFFKLSSNNILDPISFFKKTGDIADNSPDHGQLITYV